MSAVSQIQRNLLTDLIKNAKFQTGPILATIEFGYMTKMKDRVYISIGLDVGTGVISSMKMLSSSQTQTVLSFKLHTVLSAMQSCVVCFFSVNKGGLF